MDQYIGKLLDNRYEILERIGIGGMAVVYKGRDHRLNRLVAVKILKSDLAQDEDFRRQPCRRASAALPLFFLDGQCSRLLGALHPWVENISTPFPPLTTRGVPWAAGRAAGPSLSAPNRKGSIILSTTQYLYVTLSRYTPSRTKKDTLPARHLWPHG